MLNLVHAGTEVVHRTVDRNDAVLFLGNTNLIRSVSVWGVSISKGGQEVKIQINSICFPGMSILYIFEEER